MKELMKKLEELHRDLKNCRKCPEVCGRAVFARPTKTKIMLVGQAPGIHEEMLGKPFAHTAGKTLFKWLNESIGINEDEARELIYFTAVARCFPGKSATGKGDRPPSKLEIENCRTHLQQEIDLIKPQIILAVGKVAISEVLGEKAAALPLAEVVGKIFKTKFHGQSVHVIPLPHPSGVSRWPHTELGKNKLQKAFLKIRQNLLPLL